MDIQAALREYGLSNNESDVYVKLLSLGSVNLQNIAKQVAYPRTTVYNTLNYLIEKGLVSFIEKNGVKFYVAADPEKLIDKLNEKKEIIKSVIPHLKILKHNTIQTSSVQIFHGSKGLFTVLSEIFKKKQTTYYFGSYSLSKEILKYFPEHFRNIRMENKIHAKIVIDPYDEPDFHTRKFKQLTELRLTKSLKDFPCMIFIYGDKVAMYTLKKDLIGIIISNEQVAESMKMIFHIYWSMGKIANFK